MNQLNLMLIQNIWIKIYAIADDVLVENGLEKYGSPQFRNTKGFN